MPKKTVLTAAMIGSLMYMASRSLAAGGVCADDFTKFCQGVSPGGGRILKCLMQHESELSASCREKIESATGGGNDAQAGDKEESLTHDGLKRSFLIHLPANYDGNKPIPVVLAFHGGGSFAANMRKVSKLNPVADEHGFMVVYPNGTSDTMFRSFNAGTCCTYAVQHKIDDVGFVKDLIDYLQKNHKVDPNRIYATGFSNGAMLCYRLACELSDKLAAIGPVSGDLGVDGPQPSRPVPIIHFHGLQDNNDPWEGGVGKNAFQPNPHRSIPDTIAWWIKANHCQPQPVEVKKETDYIMERYEPAPSTQGAPIVLYKLPEGGHTWPGGAEMNPSMHLGHTVKSVNASEIMWQFFSEHPMNAQSGN